MRGIFFGGPPGSILEAWHEGRVGPAVSLDILSEYHRVCDELSQQSPEIDPAPFLELMALRAELFDCPPLGEQVCADRDDDKFLVCAYMSGSKCVVSGDRLLLDTNGYRGIEVIRPREFVNRYLGDLPQPTA